MPGNYVDKNIRLARTLRKSMTPEERHLWYDFLRTYPVNFYRQKCSVRPSAYLHNQLVQSTV